MAQVGSCVAVAINCPYDSPALLGAIAAGAPGAAKSPVSRRTDVVPSPPHLSSAVILTA